MMKLPAGKAVLSKDEDGGGDSNVDMDILVALVFALVMASDQRRQSASEDCWLNEWHHGEPHARSRVRRSTRGEDDYDVQAV